MKAEYHFHKFFFNFIARYIRVQFKILLYHVFILAILGKKLPLVGLDSRLQNDYRMI